MVKNSQIATLYLHESSARSTRPLLLLHGDRGHPCTTLHLADIAEKLQYGPIFSLHMPYEEGYSEISRALLKQAINLIEQLITDKEGSFDGIIAVGHSKGAIQAAHQAFVEKDERIKSLISIIGLLTFLSDFIRLFMSTCLTLVNNLPSFIALISQFTRNHDPFAVAFSIAWFVVYMHRH